MGRSSHTKRHILKCSEEVKLAMSNSKSHCPFLFHTSARQRIFKRSNKDFNAGRLVFNKSSMEFLRETKFTSKKLFSFAKYSKYDTN